MRVSSVLTAFLAAVLLCAAARVAQAGQTIGAVREAGKLACGVVTDEDDYSEADTHGNLSALGADFCRAVAAEVLGDPGKLVIHTMADEPGALGVLRDGKIDVLFGATPNPIIGETYGVRYGAPIFYDGAGLLVSTQGGIKTLADLSHRSVCFINASPPEHILYDQLEPRLAQPEWRFPYTERGEMEVALVDGHCDAMIGDISWLANVRSAFHAQIKRFTVLPERLTIDPFSPVTRVADAQWNALIDWTVWALLQAEEQGVTKENAVAMRDSSNPVVRRLTGATPWIGKAFDISDDGFLHAIQAVGNYGEIYDRDVGMHSRLELPRGRNELASRGGLMWALPVEPLQ